MDSSSIWKQFFEVQSNLHTTITNGTWASADFFPGEGKNILFALKNAKNIPFSFKKVEKQTILAGQGGQEPPLALPADAHAMGPKNNVITDSKWSH